MSAKRTGRQPKAGDSRQRGRANLRRLRDVSEDEIRETSPEELANLPDDFWDDAEVALPVGKKAISLRVDEDVLEYFRSLGPGYQTRMNAVLRSFMKRSASRVRRSK